MINTRAEMLNKKASNPESKPDQILDSLGIKKGQTIMDIGAGGGYFSFSFSEKVGKRGLIYAVDTNPDLLNYIQDKKEQQGLKNIIIVKAKKDLEIPLKSVDLIFMRNVTHHIPNRREYFRGISTFLKKNGRIAIIEYTPIIRFSYRYIFGHHIAREVIIKELEDVGYKTKECFDFLPEQSFTIFSNRG